MATAYSSFAAFVAACRWILAIPFLHGCSAPSGPDDSGGGDNEMRAVSINRHAEFAALVSTSPLSDSENQSGWVFRNDLSDELEVVLWTREGGMWQEPPISTMNCRQS